MLGSLQCVLQQLLFYSLLILDKPVRLLPDVLHIFNGGMER